MFLRLLWSMMAVAIVLVFLLPSTIAVYAAVNGTAWNLQDIQVLPLLELLAPALALFAAVGLPATLLLSALMPEVTHALAMHVHLFELECALIC